MRILILDEEAISSSLAECSGEVKLYDVALLDDDETPGYARAPFMLISSRLADTSDLDALLLFDLVTWPLP